MNATIHSLTSFTKNKFPKDLHNFEDSITETNCILNGSLIYFRVKQVPTAFEDGNQGWTLIIEDITANKTYEEALQMNEARYRGIVEDQTEFITRFRPDGTLIFVNNSYARYLGKKSSEILGQHHIPGICDKDRIVVNEAVRSLSAEHPLVSVECRIVDQSRQQRWNVWTIRALFNDEGTSPRVPGSGQGYYRKKRICNKDQSVYLSDGFFLPETAGVHRTVSGCRYLPCDRCGS